MTAVPKYSAGPNMAMKLPLRVYEQTLAFYRDTLGLPVEENDTGAPVRFRATRLHLDRLPTQSQTDLWLEVRTDDTTAALSHLQARGVDICNGVEALPDGFDGFWVAAPSGTIHLIAGEPPA